MKKQYTKPSMEVYELKQRPALLCGSGDPTQRYDYQFGYMPDFTTVMNNMA